MVSLPGKWSFQRNGGVNTPVHWIFYIFSGLCQTLQKQIPNKQLDYATSVHRFVNTSVYLQLNLFALLLLNSFSSSICQNSYLKYIFDNLRRFFKELDAVDREFKIALLNMLCNEMKPAKKKFKHTYCTDSRLYLLTNEKVNTSRIAKREYIKNCKKRCY